MPLLGAFYGVMQLTSNPSSQVTILYPINVFDLLDPLIPPIKIFFVFLIGWSIKGTTLFYALSNESDPT